MTKTIKLTQGHEAIVDDADYEYLNQWRWCYASDGYASRDQHLGKKDGKYLRQTILMHRLLLNPPKELEVDHKNRNRLDNRRDNLRTATKSQNMANRGPLKRKYRELPMGVSYGPPGHTHKPYMARVSHQGKSYFLGNFSTVDAAAQAYKLRKLQLFGEFAQ